MVWSHSPVWLLVAEISAAWVPECTGVVTTVSPAWHTHGLRLPVSNPPLASELAGGAGRALRAGRVGGGHGDVRRPRRGGRAGDQAGRADRQARGQPGGGEGERLTRGRVAAVDLRAGRGAHRPGLVTGAADGHRVARRRGGAREGELVDVPAAVVLVDGQGLLALGQGDVRRDGGPGLPAAGRRDVDVPG